MGYRKALGLDRVSLRFLYLWVSQTPRTWNQQQTSSRQFSQYTKTSSSTHQHPFTADYESFSFTVMTFSWPLWSWRRGRCRPQTAAPARRNSGGCLRRPHKMKCWRRPGGTKQANKTILTKLLLRRNLFRVFYSQQDTSCCPLERSRSSLESSPGPSECL